MPKILRLPMSAASRRGISRVAAEAADCRIVLTSLERPVAVVDSAERIDADLARVRLAARELVESFADRAASRGETHSLSAVCERLGLDEGTIRGRAAELRSGPVVEAGSLATVQVSDPTPGVLNVKSAVGTRATKSARSKVTAKTRSKTVSKIGSSIKRAK
ncbi:hypothetical protein [Occultella kanbiaonis]|uniref:hypothetical protein n=1 Tax=Occultella kanbiaonis TaxID=2675754 RepID=UPI0013D65FE7|nr:hypothetical protein [Occultella kanbiaonis]